MNQTQALKILKSGKNVFLTGSAGSGKTFVLKKFISYLKKKNKKVAITASTGIAATHIDGTTIHSWSGIGINEELSGKDLQKLANNEVIKDRFLAMEVLIIDEISMIDARILDLIDVVCKAVNRSVLPFGGLQIVLCGDFFQLPPVRSDKKKPVLAYNSESWQNSNLKICYLEEQYRHEDDLFLQTLNDIRNNKANHETEEVLGSRFRQSIASRGYITKLFSRNVDADHINNRELAKLSGKSFTYKMFAKGEDWAIEQLLKDNNRIPKELEIKKGCIVMFTKNNFEAGYVNGTMGKVVDFWQDDLDNWFPIVLTSQGKRINISFARWVLESSSEVVGSINQLPLRLAWAITIHKSQGMTLDAAEVDLSRSFGHGMGYVALSRVRSLATLNLIGFSARSLSVDPQVSEMDKKFKKDSQ